MKSRPEFFLSTAGEFGALAEPRGCWPSARLRNTARDDYMLIDIAPGLVGQTFGLGASDITQLVISARHRGQTLYPISEWPLFVYVARLLDSEIVRAGEFTSQQVEPIAWGAIFRSRDEADKYAAQYAGR